ncbi:acetoin utilization AcuB family protein [Alkalihalobacillus sp. AL-G]|uniref:acetoin utilization AcuB family protein n=1 Tax=Alkalihalobacillus sp. AL-G TaxID=2926399 RepID=UPI00272C1AD0|nr:acetoin utilization AcuB family protein [Alkalihalobacillus sp. AL-G]WLD92394.1 acetoin utilization AcuB family protein [Alkalihalobacillus sp. AL-G]
MKVEAMMNRKVVTVSEKATIEEGKQQMKQHRIRHLPVVDDDLKLIGIVSDRDLIEWKNTGNESDPASALIESVMTRNVITAHPREFIEELLSIFYDERIGCIPVVEDQHVVGIITERDMLYTLIQLTGAHQPSSQIEVSVDNIAGKLAEVTAVIKKHHVNITSVLVYPGEIELTKVLVLRVQTMNPKVIIESLRAEGYNVLWPAVPGERL